MSDSSSVEELPRVVNGIFKGGGAKGLLYAGAIRALADQGRWFRAVAGSSAGAITAALIAAGLDVDELADAARTGLGRIKRQWLGDLVGRPLFGTERVASWLEETLREKVTTGGAEVPPGDAVTFQHLYEATSIELYIVAVDVARRQPIVFCFATTPHVSVTSAAIASSAIPFAFRPGRLEVRYADDSTAVHRLMDGGVWANYPAFVFKDRSFREHHDLPPVPDESTTIGFTLEHPSGQEQITPRALLTHWIGAHGDRGAMLRGFLRIAPVRYYLMTIVPIVLAVEVGYSVDRYGLLLLKDNVRDKSSSGLLLSIAGFFDGWFSSFFVGFLPVIIVMVFVGVALAWIGATVLDSGIPAIRSLMAVGTNVPYWVGTTKGDHVVRLNVPPGLGTMSFSIPEVQVDAAIDGARREAAPQIGRIFGDDE